MNGIVLLKSLKVSEKNEVSGGHKDKRRMDLIKFSITFHEWNRVTQDFNGK